METLKKLASFDREYLRLLLGMSVFLSAYYVFSWFTVLLLYGHHPYVAAIPFIRPLLTAISATLSQLSFGAATICWNDLWLMGMIRWIGLFNPPFNASLTLSSIILLPFLEGVAQRIGIKQLWEIAKMLIYRNEALCQAASRGNLEKIERLLQFSLFQKAASEQENAPLRAAAAKGDVAIVARLLAIPAVRAQAHAQENAALRAALLESHVLIVEQLLAIQTVRNHIQEEYGILLWAAKHGHLAIVKQLLAIPSVRGHAHAQKNAALREAAGNGHFAITEQLLAIQRVRDQVHAERNFILRWAARNGHVAIVERLLGIPAVRVHAHAEVNFVLRWAAQNGHSALVEQLLAIPSVSDEAHAKNNEALRKAAENDHEHIVQLLLRLPAVHASAHAENNAVLRESACYGRAAIVEQLLNHPAVRAHAHVHENEALERAVKNNHRKAVALLLTVRQVRDSLRHLQSRPLIQQILQEQEGISAWLRGHPLQETTHHCLPLEVLVKILSNLSSAAPYTESHKNTTYFLKRYHYLQDPLNVPSPKTISRKCDPETKADLHRKHSF